MKMRSRLALYVGVVALFVLILGWWLVFFSRLGSVLADRVERTGAELSAAEIEAIRGAADSTTRMLLFEGGFLVLLLLIGVVLLLRSLRQEVALHRQRQNFLSAVTHELKTPIASAKLYLESLLLGRTPAEKSQAYLETARDELDRLGGMVDHLLETARASAKPNELHIERLDLAAFVREIAPRLAGSRAMQVEVELDAPSPVTVDASPRALETILRNLLSNASKYGGSPARARVSVSGPSDSLGSPGRARLAVRDWGPGMTNGRPGRMFDPFTRGKDELVRERPGVGLGLYLVAELARAHGGSARAGNVEDGSGFAVEVLLPLAAGAAGAAGAEA